MTITVPKSFPPKAPDAAKDYAFDAAPWLRGDTISSATWESAPTGLTFSSEELSENDRKANARISSGRAGVTYTVKCTIVTVTSGETEEFRAPLYVLNDDDY